ncbi:MAG: T9SS type A sorting domain-containing protein [Ignavibacteria bacterium]|nr:T9SS type A sorting domain-containing protein [Ignavibacteria bacterium]
MNRRFALWGGTAWIGAALLLATVIVFSSQLAEAQDKPELPILSLTGSQSSWNTTYYPDGRIWAPRRGPNGKRSLLVPVFIKNCWRSTSVYEAFPIYSFKFKVQFDSTAVEFVGVEKNGPNFAQQNMPIAALARDFEFTTSVARDTTYQSVIGAPIQNRLRGKRVMIDAVSSKPLPQTGDLTQDCDQRPFVELIYLRFNVIADPAQDPVSARTPFIITNDTLFYNDFQVGYELPLPNDPQPPLYAGLGGVNNYYLDFNQVEQIRDPLRPSKPGMIWLEVTDLIPQLSFTNQADPRFRIVDSIDGSGGDNWFIKDPITIDYGSNYDDNVNGIGTRDIDVINAVLGTRAYDVTVQSDQPWLKFKSFLKGGQGEISPFPQPVREGYIRMLDKGILGTTLGQTPNGDATVAMRDLNMRIICDPTELPDGNTQEVTGIYTGYITFKSTSLNASPVRIKVTFIYFRTPFEPNEFDENNSWQEKREFLGKGITLEVRNNADPIQRTYLVMGVGYRARDVVDTLFGESVYTNPLSGFGARWYPKNADETDIYIDGLSDLWQATANRPQAGSRDIRDIYSDTTIKYWCRFSAGSPLNYPIVVAWDTDDFIPGSELFIRDTLNGSRFNVNMRNATNIGGSRQSVTIRDADVSAFVIEYTLPKVAEFPVINKGWNLLSLPVNPSSSYWKDIFKNALNTPIRFAQNIYQTNENNLSPGIGYFVKYSDEVDKTVAGSRLLRINENAFPTRLYEGWNTMGSLSFPISTERVSLLPFGTGAFPTIVGDIYRYVTDRGYQAVSEIEPGLGYWIKIQGQAYLNMSIAKSGVNFNSVRDAVKLSSTLVTVADASNKFAELYISEDRNLEAKNVFELPPLPPYELFDVRFSNQAYVEDAKDPMIRLQGTDFPITITMNNPSRNYSVVNPVTGVVIGSIISGRNNSVVVTDKKATSIKLLGGDADLSVLGANVKPNPVSTTGTIDVTVSQSGNVRVEIFNVVGELVSVVVDESRTAGLYTFEFDAAALSAGRYIVKVTNEGNVATSAVTVVR